ncbi:MAG: hypothetical protein M4579_003361 [Chaenotheca gracillima]|nr:MAG: hypothetical protein M4579_003361 [Chaenotheca gracillima]
MLNLAVTYALDCHSAFKKAGKADRKVALRSGAQVMRALRNALTTKAEESASTILMTMRLLFAAEIFGEIGSLHYALHLSAVSELLRLRWTSGQFEELDEALVNESYFEEVVESVHNGRISAFDDPLRPRPATLGDATTFEFESASNFVRERLIRIPRLVYLVRRCSQNPDDDALVLETLALTTEIYDVKFALLVEEFITESTTIADTSSDMESAPPLQSFLFNSIQEFNLTVYYYTFRILICGIIQYMLDVQIAPQVYFDRSKVGAEDIKAAERIAMCLDYAFNPKFDPPFGALRMYKPCTLAYGSWDRLEKRERTIHGSEAPDCARALLMKQYCFEAVDRIALIWNGGGVAEELLVLTCGAFAGGPLMSTTTRMTSQDPRLKNESDTSCAFQNRRRVP